MQRRHAAICAALVIITAIPALAQEPALELQLGGGSFSRTTTCRRCRAWRPVSFSGGAIRGACRYGAG